jgi:uncharacterized protein
MQAEICAMPIDPALLDILCCPVSKRPLRRLNRGELATLNRNAEAGFALRADGSRVIPPVAMALVCADGVRLYLVEDGIPVLLPDRSLPAALAFEAASTGAGESPH